jgi:hypothetical protein
MSQLYPVPRGTRETILTASAGQTTFGPVAWLLFDTADVEVASKPVGATLWATLTSGFTVTASESLPGTFSVVFDAGRTAGEQIRIRGKRVHEQTIDVAQGGAIRAQRLDTELARMAAVLQEVRRDADQIPDIAAEVAAELAAVSAAEADASAAAAAVSETNAAASEAAAAASAAGVDLPAVGAGDALKFLRVEPGETGFELTDPPVGQVATLTALEALAPASFGAVVLRGRAAAGDGGGGIFRWDASDLSATLVRASIASSAIDAGTDTITSVAHGLQTGDAGFVSAGVNGLSADTFYYAIRVDADNFKLAASRANALAGTPFDLTDSLNFTFRQAADADEGLYVVADGDPLDGSSGAWARVLDGPVVDSRWFGLAADGATSDSPAIDAALALMPEGTVFLLDGDGTYAATGQINLPSRKSLAALGATIQAVATYPDESAVISLGIGGADQAVTGKLVVDCDDKAKYGVNGFACARARIVDVEILNYEYGLYFTSSPTAPVTDIEIVRPYIHTPGTPAVYPIQINATVAGQNIKGVRIISPRIVGSGGAFSAANDSTADQIAIQGCEDVWIENLVSVAGGENGFVFSRCSQRCTVVGGRSSLHDKNGAQIGSDLCEIDVNTTGDWAVSETLTGQSSGETGVIEAIIDRTGLAEDATRPWRVRLNTLSSGFFTNGENLTNGVTVRDISRPRYTDHVKLIGLDMIDNGIDEGAGGGALSGAFLTRARFVSIIGGLHANIVGTDQQYGVYATDAIWLATGVRYRQLAQGRWNITGADGENHSPSPLAVKAFGQSSSAGVLSNQYGGTMVHTSTGVYTLTLTQALAGITQAIVAATPLHTGNADVVAEVVSTTSIVFRTYAGTTLTNIAFSYEVRE